MRIIEGVGSSQEDDRIEAQARQPDQLHEIFLKFRAVDIPESIINTELDKKDIRPKVSNVLVECADAIKRGLSVP
jgi:hypothetical protein